jgi:hypothetical protein
VNTLQVPARGLEELRECIQNSIKNLQYSCRDGNMYFDKDMYKDYMGLLYASLYVFSVQGRISGIEDVKYGQAEELMKHGQVLSDKFKTYSKFTYQPVTLSSTSLKLLEIYLMVFRPKISNGRRDGPFDSLWLTYDGDAEDNLGNVVESIYISMNFNIDFYYIVGKSVTRYFERNISCHVTSTSIRSLIETEAEIMKDEGKITLTERNAVSTINGHSSKTTEDYYVKMSMRKTVSDSRHFFAQVTGIDDTNLFEESSFEVKAPEWGTRHPDFGKNGIKHVWTDEETNYLQFVIDKLVHNNNSKNNLMSRCLKFIRNDPNAIPIFHKDHILNSARLRAGWESISKKQKKKEIECLTDYYTIENDY